MFIPVIHFVCYLQRFRRRNRSPHTVLFDQIEDTLEDKWKRDTDERECTRRETEREKRERQFREEVARQLSIRTQLMSASTVHNPEEGGDTGRQMSGQAYCYSGSNLGSNRGSALSGQRMGSQGNEGAYSRSIPSSANDNDMDVS